jgi:uncharacterized protein YciI
MLFAIHCLDKPLSTGLRAVTRDAHLSYVAHSGEQIVIAGPLMSEDGERMAGSFIVLDAETLDDARAWNAGDPYMKIGLFESVDIRAFKWTVERGQKREA